MRGGTVLSLQHHSLWFAMFRGSLNRPLQDQHSMDTYAHNPPLANTTDRQTIATTTLHRKRGGGRPEGSKDKKRRRKKKRVL